MGRAGLPPPGASSRGPSLELVLPELRAVEQQRPELLALELTPHERPFRGLLEQVDWRLSGLLSRWTARGRITGDVGERVLVPPRRHLVCDHLLLLGAGPSWSRSNLSFNRMLASALTACDMLRVQRVALWLPHCGDDERAAAVTLELLRSQVGQRALHVLLVVQPAVHQALARAWDQR